MDEARARELVLAERTRIEAALRPLVDGVRAEGPLQRQQTGESTEVGTDLQIEGVNMALVESLQERLAEVGRAEARIAAGTFGRSIESGILIPDGRLEVEPLAERTIEEQRAVEEAGAQA